MNVYANLSYYKTTYKGTFIADSDFDRLILRASMVIDNVTNNQALEIITDNTDTDTVEKIKFAACNVAESIAKREINGGNGQIASERVGNVSTSYQTKRSNELTDATQDYNAAEVYLGLTGLMYRGL